ncbi:hypothetical protein AMR41_24135 [Hapalosiphon sp. MRB220]|nr:hypothetical protein AMR41_24135 [Hapalosiphon sp. MRB220]
MYHLNFPLVQALSRTGYFSLYFNKSLDDPNLCKVSAVEDCCCGSGAGETEGVVIASQLVA